MIDSPTLGFTKAEHLEWGSFIKNILEKSVT